MGVVCAQEALYTQGCQAAHPEMGVLSIKASLGNTNLLSPFTEVVCLIQEFPTVWALFVGITAIVGLLVLSCQ